MIRRLFTNSNVLKYFQNNKNFILKNQNQNNRPSLNLNQRYSSQLTNIIRPIDENDKSSILQIQSIKNKFFKLSNDLIVPSNFLILNNNQIFLWNSPSNLNLLKSDHFKIFEILDSRPELLVLGAGPNLSSVDQSNLSNIKSYLNSLGIQLDVLDTRNACSNYNLLVEEGRSISGAFLTLEPVNFPTED